MNLRGKLISAIIAPAIISVAIVSVVISLQINTLVNDLIRTTTKENLILTERYVNEILNAAKNTSSFMASLPEVKNAMGKWTKYFELKSPAKPGSVATDPSEKLLYRMANRMKKSHSDFAYVYVGLEDGGYVQQGDEIINTDYDPRKRPWYEEGKNSSTETTLLNAYITTMGIPNLAVTTKIYDNSSKFIGISTVDISLAKLTSIIRSISIGKTGYVMLIQGDETILSDPKFPEHNTKKLQELNQPAFERISNTSNAILEGLDISGTEYAGMVVTSAVTGWKLVALVEEEEINQASNQAIINIIIIGIIVIVLSGLLGGLFVTTGVVKPITALVRMTQDITLGKYDSHPQNVQFKSELRILFENMKLMVEKLVKTISSNELKTKEAEEKTNQANIALADADQAKQQAERAKSEGLLQAAQHLEGVVAQVTAISKEMRVDSQNIRQGAEMQSERIQSTASAMEEMTATILEVAKNSNRAVSIANEAKDRALQGKIIVQNTIEAMQTTHNQTAALKTNMHLLGDKIEAIGAIMTVIEDIADQTNLLALNAAIEAARAGEAGRGFAVVADEVRKLAEKTMGATKKVGESIKLIQDGAKQNISTVEQAVTDLDKAVNYSNESGKILEEIVSGAESSADEIQSIATASEEQSVATEEINHSVDDVNHIASETLVGVEQTVFALHELTTQLDTLTDLISDLKKESKIT